MPNKQISSEQLTRQLQPVYQYLSHRYTSGIQVPESLPAAMRQNFYKGLADYDRTMATAVSKCVLQSFADTENLSGDLQKISEEMQQQTKRLSKQLSQMERRVQVYQTLAREPEYPIYLFLSEQGEATCETCTAHHGESFTAAQLWSSLWLLPPVHPNCR